MGDNVCPHSSQSLFSREKKEEKKKKENKTKQKTKTMDVPFRTHTANKREVEGAKYLTVPSIRGDTIFPRVI